MQVLERLAINRELLDELLTTQGFQVVAVPDGAAGIRSSSTSSKLWSAGELPISFLGAGL